MKCQSVVAAVLITVSVAWTTAADSPTLEELDAQIADLDEQYRVIATKLCAMSIVKFSAILMGKELAMTLSMAARAIATDPEGMERRMHEAIERSSAKVAVIIDAFMIVPDDEENQILETCVRMYRPEAAALRDSGHQ